MIAAGAEAVIGTFVAFWVVAFIVLTIVSLLRDDSGPLDRNDGPIRTDDAFLPKPGQILFGDHSATLTAECWTCLYCGGSRSLGAQTCPGCGAPRVAFEWRVVYDALPAFPAAPRRYEDGRPAPPTRPAPPEPPLGERLFSDGSTRKGSR